MNPLFHTDCSISDSLKSVRKSVLIYETIIGILNDNLQKLPEDKKGDCAIALMETIDLLQGGSMDDAVAVRSDYAVLEIIGIPLITASAMEYVLIAAYEKNGAVGALAAVILEVSFYKQ